MEIRRTLLFHLKNKHPSEFKEVNGESTGGSPPDSSSRASTTTIKPADSTQVTQPTLPATIQAMLTLLKSSIRYKKITNAVCYFLARDMQPYDTVNDVGFRQMLKVLEPRYFPPDRKTISTRYFPKLFETEREKVKANLKNVTSFSITTDMWTSRTKHSYTALTVHYLNNSFELCCHMLDTKEFQEEHTGIQIAAELKEILESWGLSEECLIAATFDNGSNIVNALDQLNWINIRCFAHTLQLAVLKAVGVSAVSKALARCRNLVSHFNQTSKSTNLLRKKQADLKHESLCLIQEVATRPGIPLTIWLKEFLVSNNLSVLH